MVSIQAFTKISSAYSPKLVNLAVDRFSSGHLIFNSIPIKFWERNLSSRCLNFEFPTSISSSRNLATKTMSDKRPILYSYFRSSASWRVRIALEFKGIEYEYKAVNLLKGEQLGEEYMKISPMAQVPALVYDGKTFTQSMAILDLLEDLYPEVEMIPKDPFLKAKAREVSDIVNSGIQPLQNLSVAKKYSDDPEKRTEWAHFWVNKGLTALEAILSQCSGKYCVGDKVTIADASFFPQVASASRFNVDVEKFPTVNRIYKNLGELESFKKAHAFTQPDCPEELRGNW